MKIIPHQLTSNVKLLHKVALVYQNNVLVLKRSAEASSRPDKWDLAGGNSEWPEQERHGHGFHQADVAREILEETGIVVPADYFDFSALTYFDTYYDSKKEVVTVICGWKYQLPINFDPQEIIISDEHSAFKWVEREELAEIDFGGTKGAFVESICLASL